MSRIGKQPITVPAGVSMEIIGSNALVKGPKGQLEVLLQEGVSVSQEENYIKVEAKTDQFRGMQGLLRTLLYNAVAGVHTGWTKELELHGVGMRASVSGSSLTLGVGFSHPVEMTPPEGITFQVNKNTILVSGIDKQVVGEVAAQIRKVRPPEPYKGKGIRYKNEYVRRKAGKTGKTK